MVPLALAHYDSMLKSMGNDSVKVISEANELKNEYDEEINSEK